MRYGIFAPLTLGAVLLMTGCSTSPEPVDPRSIPAPRAPSRSHELVKHGHVRHDEYFWLNQRDDPEVIAYLDAENDYLDKLLAHTEPLQQELFDEMVGRIKQDDASVPYRKGDYWYYTRFEPNGEYALHCRKRGSLEADDQVMLDGNRLAEGHDFFSLRGASVSSGQNIVAYATDVVGRRIYTIRFKNLDTGETLADEIPAVTGNVAWAEDNRTLFYTRQDPQTLRSYQVWRHEVGTDPSQDVLVYEERDDTFSVAVFKTKSKRFVMIAAYHTLSNEYRYLDASDPTGEFRVVLPRQRDHEYGVDHFGDDFYIRTNDRAKNFRLMKTPVAAPSRDNWTEVIPHREDVLLEGFEIFADYLVVAQRRNGLVELRVRPWSGDGEYGIEFDEPAYSAWIDVNPEFDTRTLRYGYTSLTTPQSIYDHDMATRQRRLMKREPVLGGFEPDNYRTERLYATARDGVRVPISLVYRRGFQRDGSAPLLLYGYGSYGASIDAAFRSYRLSLIDRGFVFAIAHVRGGEELGREWYEDGKLFNKKNTFTDFIDCARHLVAEKYADPGQVFAQGGSAGGLLMGAVINMEPELFRGVVAEVPFVDVVTTMLDDSIPLTTSEYDEWGDPNRRDFYEYMLSYSPYDNIEAKAYPNLLVTTGLHDSQVQYWEPAKWVARLRATKTDENLLLLRTDMDAGHGGASGRFKRYRDEALIYAFILDLTG